MSPLDTLSPPASATAPSRRAKERPEPARRKVERRRIDGTLLGEVDLDPEMFGIEPNVAVMHQVVTAQLAAARAGTQSTKTRAEVAGGGAKPFRQKGTGRARQGSTRAPQWTGGGVALGPKPRSYRQRTPKKMVRLALRSALSDRASLSRVALVDRLAFEVPRTKDAIACLDALGLDGRVLVVVGRDDWAAERSFANLGHVQVTPAAELNTYDLLRNDWVLFTDETLPGGVGEVDDEPAAEDAAEARDEPAGEDAAGARDEPASEDAGARSAGEPGDLGAAAEESTGESTEDAGEGEE